MRRLFVVAMAAALVVSAAAIATADDGVTDTETTELNEKQQLRAERLADYFGPRLAGEDADSDVVDAETTELLDQVVEFRTGDERVGWGALYKLMLLAEYEGTDLATVAEGLRADGGGWGFGKAFKELRGDAEWAESSDTPRNFGQWKKQQRQGGGGD